MLTCRLIVEYQIKRKERIDKKEKEEKLSKQQPQQGSQSHQQQPVLGVGKSAFSKDGRQQTASSSSTRAKKED